MSAFSASVLLADLDYIAPSQQCILPLQQLKEKQKEEQRLKEGGGGAGVEDEVIIHTKNQAPASSFAPQALLEKVQITLQDCLACAGCVTSAETLLITNQSRGEVERLSALVKASRRRARSATSTNNNNNNDNGVSSSKDDDETRKSSPIPFLVTVSDQTAAAAAVVWQCSFSHAMGRISAFCRRVWGATHVVPLAWAQAVSCSETANEFVRRIVASEQQLQQQLQHETSVAVETQRQLPLIISACPGWVCYCEKTHPTLLPLMCPIMSAQAIAGHAFKNGMINTTSASSSAVSVLESLAENEEEGDEDSAASARSAAPSAPGFVTTTVTSVHLPPAPLPYTPSSVHVSIQPCFDKKLEAVRPEFKKRSTNNNNNETSKQKRIGFGAGADADDDSEWFTDCVLSTKELIDWIAQDEATSSSIGQSPAVAALDSTRSALSPALFPLEQRQDRPAAAYSAAVSGGYHLAAMAALARHRGITDFDLADVQYTERRGNKNFRIATHPKLLRLQQRAVKNDDDGSPAANSNQDAAAAPQLLQFALVYGFQHIQNVVRAFSSSASSSSAAGVAAAAAAASGRRVARKVQRAAVPAQQLAQLNPAEDFVLIEAMACPSGCTNGGGQMMEILEPEVHEARLNAINARYMEGFWPAFVPEQMRPTPTSSILLVSAQALLTEVKPNVRTSFTNRREEFEKLMNDGGAVSLKW